ncbi:MAG: DegV family protein [Dehalococcoidia bacterium]|nr:DegV family protein [Dehalococcoidia bacterium]
MKVAIITDSNTCLPRELVDQYGITVVPIQLAIDGRVYHDGVDITPSELYRLLPLVSKIPTTAAPSPGSYLETYRQLAQRFDNILCITISSQFSAIHESAQLARQMAAEVFPQVRINVIDSGTAAMAQGFAVLEAARAAAQSKDLDEVTAAAVRISSRTSVLAILDTLNYLAKSGRVPKIAAWAGSVLNIKPIIELSQSHVGLLARPRTKRQSVQRLLQEMNRRLGARPAHIAVVHTNVPAEAEELRQRIESMFNCVEMYVTEFTPVMGIHTGPGLLGAAFYSEG